MARMVFPDEGSRLVFRAASTGNNLQSANGAIATVYTSEAATTTADIQTTAGAAIPGAQLVVDQYSRLPLFLGPDDVDTVWVRVDGGPATPVYARSDDRLDAKLDAAFASGTYATRASVLPEQATAAQHSTDRNSLNLPRDHAEAIFLPATAFDIHSGTAPLQTGAASAGARFLSRQMVDAAHSEIKATWFAPLHWERYGIDILWSTPSATAGDVRWTVNYSGRSAGDDLTAGAEGDGSPRIAAAAGANVLVKTLVTSRAYAGLPFTGTTSATVKKLGAVHHLRVARTGADAADTLAADAQFIGVIIRRIANPLYIVGDGNSLTSGQGAGAGEDYLTRVKALLTDSASPQTFLTPETVNLGLGGQTTPDMTADGVTQVDALYVPNSAGRAEQVLCAWEGSNDLISSTAQVAYDNLVTYCLARRAAGWRVVVGTVLPRSNTSLTDPVAWEARRQDLNAMLRAGWPQFADALADVAMDPLIGRPGAELNTTYYDADRVHLKAAGYQRVAQMFAPAVRRASRFA